MKYKTLIFFAIGIVIMAIMLWFIGIDQVMAALKLANPLYILIAVLIQMIIYVLFTVRWQFITNLNNNNFSFKKLLPMVLVSLAFNNITPSGRGGGEPVRAYLLTNESGEPFSDTFATVITDRALDTMPFVLLAIITIIGLMGQINLSPVLLIIMIVSVICIVALVAVVIYMSINEKFGVKITKIISSLAIRIFKKRDPERLKNRIEKSVSGFQSTMRVLTTNRKVMYFGIPISFLIWALEISRVYVVFLAFGCKVTPILIGEIFIVSSLVGMIPLLPGGLGAIDGFMILLYKSAGISTPISAASTVVERLISFWMTTIIGLIILPKYGKNIFEQLYSILSSNSEEKNETSET